VIIEPRFTPDQRRQINDLPPAEVLAKDRVIIEPGFSPNQRRQINDLLPAEVLAKDSRAENTRTP